MIRTAEIYTKYTGDKGIRYYKYIPSNGVKPIGLILFYCGMGERSFTDLTLVERNGLPAYLKVDGVREGVELNYIVLAPQETPDQEWWSKATDCVKLAQSFNLPIHKCGLSLGSMIDSEIINKLVINPFATIATCCGKINEFPATITELSKIPTLHGYAPEDKTISNGYPSVKGVYTKLKTAGSDTEMVEYPGAGHAIWDEFYSPAKGNKYLGWLNSKVVTPPPVQPTRETIVDQWIEAGKLHTKGSNGTIIIN